MKLAWVAVYESETEDGDGILMTAALEASSIQDVIATLCAQGRLIYPSDLVAVFQCETANSIPATHRMASFIHEVIA